jgi:hypothetical protein
MGWFKNITKFVAKVDRAINPQHKYVQDQITEKVFHGDQMAALNTGHAIGVGVVDYFFPGVGSALNATDQYQDKNYKGARISLVSAVFQGYASGSFNSSSPTSGSGVTIPADGSVGVGAANAGASSTSGAGIVLQSGQGVNYVGSAATYATAADYATAVYNADQAVVGFTSSDLGAGITTSEAQAVGAQNLTWGDVRQGTSYQKALGNAAIKAYSLLTRDGTVKATFYGADQMQELPQSSINYQFSAPNFMNAIPSNAAADARGAALSTMAATQAANNRAIMFAAVAGAFLYFSGALK